MKTAMNMTRKEMGYMTTQYEKFGGIGREELLQLIADETEVEISDLSEYNEFLIERGYEPYFEDLDAVLDEMTGSQAAMCVYFGKCNLADDYFQFNGYANIDSFSEYEIVREMNGDEDFKRYLAERQLEKMDENEIQEIINYGNAFVAAGY